MSTMRARLPVILPRLAVAAALPAVSAATPTWRTFADCAVSYHIDALDKELNRYRNGGMQQHDPRPVARVRERRDPYPASSKASSTPARRFRRTERSGVYAEIAARPRPRPP